VQQSTDTIYERATYAVLGQHRLTSCFYKYIPQLALRIPWFQWIQPGSVWNKCISETLVERILSHPMLDIFDNHLFPFKLYLLFPNSFDRPPSPAFYTPTNLSNEQWVERDDCIRACLPYNGSMVKGLAFPTFKDICVAYSTYPHLFHDLLLCIQSKTPFVCTKLGEWATVILTKKILIMLLNHLPKDQRIRKLNQISDDFFVLEYAHDRLSSNCTWDDIDEMATVMTPFKLLYQLTHLVGPIEKFMGVYNLPLTHPVVSHFFNLEDYAQAATTLGWEFLEFSVFKWTPTFLTLVLEKLKTTPEAVRQYISLLVNDSFSRTRRLLEHHEVAWTSALAPFYSKRLGLPLANRLSGFLERYAQRKRKRKDLANPSDKRVIIDLT
jgi:hypothetical protein